eukprot:1159621-Pelagomonas_calceolata.AAC.21
MSKKNGKEGQMNIQVDSRINTLLQLREEVPWDKCADKIRLHHFIRLQGQLSLNTEAYNQTWPTKFSALEFAGEILKT